MFEGADTLRDLSVAPECMRDDTMAWVHSFETGGTGDGPGIRFIVFLQGCPLQCLYCHNPDTRSFRTGRRVSVEETMREIRRYRTYFRASGGGVTVSGGEPLMQSAYVAELFRKCREEGIHTALDTCGYAPLTAARAVLEHTDLVLLDLKSSDPATHRLVTGRDQDRVLNFARYCAAYNKPIWVRFVLVPGLTDAPANIDGAARIAASLGTVQRVDVLPFHKMGEYKWEELGERYLLNNTPTPSQEHVEKAIAIFQRHGLDAR